MSPSTRSNPASHTHAGLTNCETTAIFAKWPDSGSEVLDAMLRAARRRDAETAILCALISRLPNAPTEASVASMVLLSRQFATGLEAP